VVSDGPGGLSDKTGRRDPPFDSGNSAVERSAAAVREIAEIAGISVGTAHDLRSRIRQGEDPARPAPAGSGKDPALPSQETSPCTHPEAAP